MFERSEFGRRAASGEARREPMRLHRIGECPAMAVLLTFDKTKVSRANSAEALFFALRLDLLDKPNKSKCTAFARLRVRVPF